MSTHPTHIIALSGGGGAGEVEMVVVVGGGWMQTARLNLGEVLREIIAGARYGDQGTNEASH